MNKPIIDTSSANITGLFPILAQNLNSENQAGLSV